MAYDPRRTEFQIARHQDHMITSMLLLIPEANDAGVEWALPLVPHMLHPAHEGAGLIGPRGMGGPLPCHRGTLHCLLCCQPVGFERDDDIDLPSALQVRHRCPVEKAPIFE